MWQPKAHVWFPIHLYANPSNHSQHVLPTEVYKFFAYMAELIFKVALQVFMYA